MSRQPAAPDAAGSATAALAELAAGTTWQVVPGDVRSIAGAALLEAIACGVAGSQTPPARLAREALGLPGPAEATLLGRDTRTTALMAAHHNALAINALDFDDQAPYGGHPGSAVAAAALAVAERHASSGAALMQAVVAGYEVAMRIQAAIRPSREQYARVHGNGTPLAFGAAAAAGRLLALDAPAMRRAFGIAAALSPVPHGGKFGWEEPTLPWVKDNVAWPAEAGVRAALLASAGMPASTTVLDGDTGFWRMAASDRCDWALLLDTESYALRELAFKPYPCCRWLHTMLDAADGLRNEAGVDPVTIRSVRVETTEGVAARFGEREPRSLVDAEFSAPYAVAALLADVPRAAWWRVEDHRASALRRRLAASVELLGDPGLTERHDRQGRSSNRVPARVTVTLEDGTRLRAESDLASGSPGHRGSPRHDPRSKAAALLASCYAPSHVARVLAAIDDLPATTDCTDLLGLLRGPHDADDAPRPQSTTPRKDPT